MPTDLHHDITIAALRAGKHVLCEKPVALDAHEATEMLDVAESTGLAHAVNFEGRWLPERFAVWQMVKERYVGNPLMATVSTVNNLWHPIRPLQSEWMYSKEAGGGYLMGMASHDIDYFHALFGQPVSVCAEIHTSTPERVREDGTILTVTADDSSTILLRTQSGFVGTIATSMVGLHVDFRNVEIYGDEGTILINSVMQGTPENTSIRAGRIDDEGLRSVPLSDRQPIGGAEIPNRKAGMAIRALALLIEDWLPAFDGKPTPNVPNLRDGLIAQQVVDAARFSAAGGGWIDLEPTP